ncbi:HET-domain-containing protein [Xylariaceae sp. FL0255]|nr:HET-domain-containing protein [Xylariaceae sp. FL0255]
MKYNIRSLFRSKSERLGPTPQATQETRPVDPCWIDLDEVRRWINICDHDHGTQCQSNRNITDDTVSSGRPDWLINVVQECIVPAGLHQYVALSYLWGNVEGTESTRLNLDTFQLPGALSESNAQIQIPRTIRHTMRLLTLLGQRYLWDLKHSQLTSMCDIYEQAYFTIIAANGWDANHGLRGIRGATERRHLIEDGRITLEQLDVARTVWWSRGWTFQEMLYSPRKLFGTINQFLYQTMAWKCDCATHSESIRSLPTSIRSNPYFHQDWRFNSDQDNAMDSEYLPELKGIKGYLEVAGQIAERDLAYRTVKTLTLYRELINQFNIRSLTYPEDGLNAFLGILARLIEYFPQGFLWGMPVSMFDIAILWQPDRTMTRRQTKKAGALQIPSWAWSGWEGSISEHSWYGVYDDDIRNTPDSALKAHVQGTVPITKFKYLKDGKVYPLEPRINSSGRGHGKTMLVGTSGLSPILFAHSPVVKCFIRSDGRDYDAVNKWLWEFPVPNEDSQQGLLPCGVIAFTSHVTLPSGPTECELLVLSSASESLPLRHESAPSLWSLVWRNYTLTAIQKEMGYHEYYNVLWIVRSNGIAYRQGLGKIPLAAWETINPQWEDIRLG